MVYCPMCSGDGRIFKIVKESKWFNKVLYVACLYCNGTGRIKEPE